MKRVLLSCLVLAITMPALSAQARKVSFRTLCLEFADELREVVIPGKTTAESEKVTLYTDLSPVVEGTFLTPSAEFFTEKPGPDGKPVRELVAKAPLGKSARQLFVFIPSGPPAKGKLPYRLECYDDDVKSFGMGHVRAINLAPVPVRFILAGQTTPQIPPAKFAQFPHSKKTNDYNMYPVVVEFLSGNGQWVQAQSVGWQANDGRRDIVITLVEPKFNQPTVKKFSDIPPWTEP